LQEFHKIRPLLLVGADHSHLLCSTECVRFGPPGSPAALHTCLGWTLHGLTSLVQESSSDTRCLLTSLDKDQLQRDVERLWQIDIFPYSKNSKAVIRSKQDQQAFECLEQQTERHEINGIERYATPLLRRPNAGTLKAPKEAVLASLRSTERRLAKDPNLSEAYCTEMNKLEQAGYVAEISNQEAEKSTESWYIPHHMVNHNGKKQDCV